MMRNLVCFSLLGFTLAGFPRAGVCATFFGPAPYTSFADSPFSAVGFDYFHLENFEDGTLNTPGVAATGSFSLPPGALTDSVDADDGLIDGFGTAGRSWYVTATSVTFTFDENVLGKLPTHAGMVFTDVGFVLNPPTHGLIDISFEAFDADNNSLGVVGPVPVGDGAFAGQTAEDRFFGVRHSGGISRISFSLASDDWEMDHLQYGAVPEPSTLLLAAWVVPAVVRRRSVGRFTG